MTSRKASSGKPRSQKWRSVHERTLADAGLALGADKWSSTHALVGVPKAERYTSLIDIVWALHLKKGGRPDDPALYCDISQNLERLPFSSHCRALTRSSLVYSYRHDRVLVGRDHLSLLGFDPARFSNMDRFSQKAQKDLAGDAMSPPSVCFAMMILIVSLDWGDLWATPAET